MGFPNSSFKDIARTHETARTKLGCASQFVIVAKWRNKELKKEGCVSAPGATGVSPWSLAIDLRSTRRQRDRA